MPRKPTNRAPRDRLPARRRSRGGASGFGVRARAGAAGTILVVWAASTLADIWSASYSPPEGVNTLALAAATYLFGSAFLKERD